MVLLMGKCKTKHPQSFNSLKFQLTTLSRLVPQIYTERNRLVDFNEQKHVASSVETHGQRNNIYIYLFSTYLFNLLAGLGCWIWFYILNYKIYDGNVCQLFAEGKKDLCSLF